jgi:imidazolonepropionase-like amidohydrolase
VLAAKPDFIKIYLEHSDDPEKRRGLLPDVAQAIVRRAHAHELRVAAHVTSAGDFRIAVEAGADQIAHLPLGAIDPAAAAAAAKRGVVVVTTTLSHRPAPGIADLAAVHRANLALLRKAGVTVILGVDDAAPTVVDEAENVVRLGVYTVAEVLRMLVETTPRAMFPGRRIGRLEEGAEASLLALDANPLEDLGALRRVTVRVKQGHLVEIAPEKAAVVDVLLPLAMAEGADTAIAEYRRLLREEGEEWDFREAQLNRLGYALL